MVSAYYSVLQSVLLFVACCIYFCIFPMTQLILNFTCFAIKFMYLFLNSSNTFTKGYVCTMYILWCFCHLVLGLLTQQVNKLDWIELSWIESLLLQGLSCITSVYPGKCHNSTRNYGTVTSLHFTYSIFPISYYLVRLHVQHCLSNTMRSISEWVTHIFPRETPDATSRIQMWVTLAQPDGSSYH